MQLIDTIFDIGGHEGSADEWLESKGFNMETITEVEIERFISEIKTAQAK